MSMLSTHYKEKVMPALREKFGYKNVHEVPKLEKVVVNCTTKDAVSNSKVIDEFIEQLGLIAGQKPVVASARKSNASFKIREGMPLGAAVTLRGERMYEFLERLIHVALPRVRDFRGISPKAFDGRGNYTLGVKEQIIFPEINIDKVNRISGLDISFVTTANTDKEAKALLTELGLPFKKK